LAHNLPILHSSWRFTHNFLSYAANGQTNLGQNITSPKPVVVAIMNITTLLLLHLFNGLFSRTTWVSWHQKGKPFSILPDHEITMESAGPYANHLHLAPDREPCQYHTTQFLQAGCPSCHPTDSVKALRQQ